MRGDNFTKENWYNKYFLPRLKIDNYNIDIDGSKFYDQAINDSIKQYDEIGKKYQQDQVAITQLVVY